MGFANKKPDIEIDDDDFVNFNDEKTKLKAYEVEFTVLSPEKIKSRQNEQIEQIKTMFALPTEHAAILLRYFRWNKEKLVEKYMENPEVISEKSGIVANGSELHQKEVVPGFVCDICCDDEDGMLTYALDCGHRFCCECYQKYLIQKIQGEGESSRIQCPETKCNVTIDDQTIKLLVPQTVVERYHELLDRVFVDDNDTMVWCPAPDCTYAIDCPITSKKLKIIVPTVECICGNKFCFGCSLSDHRPAPCGLVKLWLQKCADDSETANWISANTKECTNCSSTIEKNGGCNHMVCKKCRHEFCWVCMGPWKDHGTNWYNCNRFDETLSINARDVQAKSRASLERYLHVSVTTFLLLINVYILNYEIDLTQK